MSYFAAVNNYILLSESYVDFSIRHYSSPGVIVHMLMSCDTHLLPFFLCPQSVPLQAEVQS